MSHEAARAAAASESSRSSPSPPKQLPPLAHRAASPSQLSAPPLGIARRQPSTSAISPSLIGTGGLLHPGAITPRPDADTPPPAAAAPAAATGGVMMVAPRPAGATTATSVWSERAAVPTPGAPASGESSSGSGSGNASPDRGPPRFTLRPRPSSTVLPGAVDSSGVARSGAETIAEGNTGSIGRGSMVAADGNVHHDPAHGARPVVLLPDCCEGALGLQIPPLLQGPVSNVTLPSRLALLGRQSYETLAALRPINLGNAVLGFAPVWGTRLHSDLFVLPWIFSKGGARITFFLRILLLLVFLVFFFQYVQIYDLNIGRAWIIGTAIAIFVMYRLALIRRAPDGVMAFCRSMGAPEIEEYMFSYSWKVEPEAIRTLAKAVHNNGVGVWVDVVKLCPGDEIRPMVRTMMNRVYRCVVFLSPAYIASPNCCVEFHEAVQWPEKLVCCILEPVPQLEPFLATLQSRGAVVVTGLRALISQLDDELCDVSDADAWKWWRKQRISGGGVPKHVVPTYWHSIPRFSLSGAMHVPTRSLTAGPVYLAGDCSEAGLRFFPPYLFFLAVIALAANAVDLWLTFRNNNCSLDASGCKDEMNCHTTIDYIWLGIVGLFNLAPFTAFGSLFETRHEVHPVMRPLLASKSLTGGVRIRIVGEEDDPIVRSLNKFLTQIGHNAADAPVSAEQRRNSAATRPAFQRGISSFLAPREAPRQKDKDAGMAAGFRQCVTVYVMRTLAARDRLFGSDLFPFDPRSSLFVWSDLSCDPFTKCPIGERLMRFLVLVAAWDRKLLAENLFSAISVRVVDLLHSADEDDAPASPRAEAHVLHAVDEVQVI